MKQQTGLSIKQRQQQKLSVKQIQMLDFMSKNQGEIDCYIEEVFESNPTLEIEDGYKRDRGLHFDQVLSAYQHSPSFKDDLYLQSMEVTQVNPQVMSYLIESINADGFIPASDLQLAREINCREAEVTQCRQVLQHFEPLGIGSQSLKDLLIVHLQQSQDPQAQKAIQLIDEFMSTNHYHESEIKKKLQIRQSQLESLLNLIHEIPTKFDVNQRVGNRQLPDVIVTAEEEDIQWQLTRDYSKIVINQAYRNKPSSQIEAWYKESQLLIEKINFRNQTLFAILVILTERQRSFFLKQKPLVPLSQQDLAQALSVNPSTISRAISNKVMLFNGEIYALSDLCVAKTSQGSSSSQIKQRLLQIVLQEETPYSDQKIIEILAKEGMVVNRRTLTKYRQALNIPSSAIRKRGKKWD